MSSEEVRLEAGTDAVARHMNQVKYILAVGDLCTLQGAGLGNM